MKGVVCGEWEVEGKGRNVVGRSDDRVMRIYMDFLTV